ncbi:MAG: CPBP family intramembrane glutamic endopeptidase [Spirochaetota bacterium]
MIDGTLFLTGSLVLSGVCPIVLEALFPHLCVPVQILITVYFFMKNSPLRGPSLYLLLFLCTFFMPWFASFWLFNLLIATAVYLVVLLLFTGLKDETGWLKPGNVDRLTAVLIGGVVAASAASLLLWSSIVEPDFTQYLAIIPRVGLPLLIAGVAGYSVCNAVLEEVLFRGVFWDGLEKVMSSTAVILVLQAVFFGLRHYHGVPSGFVGMGLSFCYGLVLGVLRVRSGGLAAPIAAHVFADTTIAFMVLKSGGRI